MRPTLAIPAVLWLAACGAQEPTAPREAAPPAVETREAALPAAQAVVIPAGPAATVTPDEDIDFQLAASVAKLDPLTQQGGQTVKLFGMAGGDPAMNGLQTYIAFFRSPADGWAVFRIGDVLDYRILSEAPGRVDLELTESHLNQTTGEIGSRTRRIIVGWPAPADGSAPASVTVTPAQ